MKRGVVILFGLVIIPIIASVALSVYLLILIIKALKRYINSGEVREEKKTATRSLGEAIKKRRVERKMTQEFVAEHLGVSRQAVSKWESGKSDPSTSNLIALAKLFDCTAEEMLKEVNTQER